MSNPLFNKNDFPFQNISEVYLDSAATSRTPLCVLKKMNEYYTSYRAPVHRGMYVSAVHATNELELVRQKVVSFIGAEKDEIIFTSGSTAAAQLLIATLEHNLELQEGDEVVVSEFDHHATLVPLREVVKRKKLVLTVVSASEKFTIDSKSISDVITEKTKIVSLIHGSNVTGNTLPIKEVIASIRTKNKNVFMIVDAAQTVGHMDVSFKNIDADALFFSGHKMCGPTGVGVLVMKKKYIDVFIPPYGGGSAVLAVSHTQTIFAQGYKKFEAGTPAIAGILGLGKAIEYVEQYATKAIHEYVKFVYAYAYEELKKVPFVKMYGAPVEQNCGVLSIVIDGVHPHDVAHILAEKNVAVRAGYQCAELTARKINEQGVVRVSLYGYTTKEDIDALVHALQSVQKIFSL